MGINFVTRFAELKWLVKSAQIDESTKGKYLARLAEVEKMASPGFLTRLFSPAMAARDKKIAEAMARLDREIRALPTYGPLDRNAARFAESGTLALGDRLSQLSDKERLFAERGASAAVLLAREERLGSPIVIDLSKIPESTGTMVFDIGRDSQYGVVPGTTNKNFTRINLTKDDSVSRGKHVRITYDPADHSVKISDRRSSNGTFVDGKKIDDHRVYLDERIGDIEVRAGKQRIVIKPPKLRELTEESVGDTAPLPSSTAKSLPAVAPAVKIEEKMATEIKDLLSELKLDRLEAEVRADGDVVIIKFIRRERPNSGSIKLTFPTDTSSEEIRWAVKDVFRDIDPFSPGIGADVSITFVSDSEMEMYASLFRTDPTIARRNGLVHIGHHNTPKTATATAENGVINLLDDSRINSGYRDDRPVVDIYVAKKDYHLGAALLKTKGLFGPDSPMRPFSKGIWR